MELDTLPWNEHSSCEDRHDALLRKLAVKEAERLKLDPKPGEVACRIQLFRDRFRLESVEAIRGWLSHAGINFDKLASFFRAESLLEKIEQLYAANIERELEVRRAFLAACAGRPRSHASSAADAMVDRLGEGLTEPALRRRILLTLLASRELERRGRPVLWDEVEETSGRFRERFGLSDAHDLTSWLAFFGLRDESFWARMGEFAAVLRLERESAAATAEWITLRDAVRTASTWSERCAEAC